jgi:hypothetical protein
MSRVPLISSPCPFRWNSAPQPGQDFCGHCQRQVHNLDFMSQSEREAFLSGCSGKICVSYTVRRPVRTSIALGASLAAAAALSGSAGAQAPAPVVMPDSPYCDDSELLEVQVTGGATAAGEKLQWVDEVEVAVPDKADLPEISTMTWLPTPKT